ncbi:MAG TPA: hypothetical protein VLZ33_02695 [Dysgonamonadaceae bacterium]|nr:hypothetical protein [Dysgonamonadaceae bacterium]
MKNICGDASMLNKDMRPIVGLVSNIGLKENNLIIFISNSEK